MPTITSVAFDGFLSDCTVGHRSSLCCHARLVLLLSQVWCSEPASASLHVPIPEGALPSQPAHTNLRILYCISCCSAKPPEQEHQRSKMEATAKLSCCCSIP